MGIHSTYASPTGTRERMRHCITGVLLLFVSSVMCYCSDCLPKSARYVKRAVLSNHLSSMMMLDDGRRTAAAVSARAAAASAWAEKKAARVAKAVADKAARELVAADARDSCAQDVTCLELRSAPTEAAAAARKAWAMQKSAREAQAGGLQPTDDTAADDNAPSLAGEGGANNVATGSPGVPSALSEATDSNKGRPSVYALGRASLMRIRTVAALKALAQGSQNLTIVKFMRPQCRACKTIEDQFIKLAGTNPQQRYIEFSLERSPEAAEACCAFGIQKLPTIQVFEGDTCIASMPAVSRLTFRAFETELQRLARERKSHEEWEDEEAARVAVRTVLSECEAE